MLDLVLLGLSSSPFLRACMKVCFVIKIYLESSRKKVKSKIEKTEYLKNKASINHCLWTTVWKII